MLLLEDAQRLDRRGALGADEIEPKALPLPHVSPADVDGEGHAVLADDEDGPHVLDAAFDGRGEMGGDAFGSGPAREPETEIDQRQAEVEHRSAAGLLTPQPPSEQLATGLERVPSGAHGLQGAEVAAREKPSHRLDIGAKPVVHPHHHPLAVFLARLEDALHATEVQGQGPLAQDVGARRQR